MKRFGTVCCALFLLTSLALVAGPASGSFIPTVNRGQAIGTLVELMSTANSDTPPGLAVALNRHAQKAAQDIAALSAIDTTTMTAEECQEVAAALTAYNQLMRDAFAVLRDKGYVNEANAYADCVNALITYADNQGVRDPIFGGAIQNAPSAGTIWGTVGRLEKIQ